MAYILRAQKAAGADLAAGMQKYCANHRLTGFGDSLLRSKPVRAPVCARRPLHSRSMGKELQEWRWFCGAKANAGAV